MSAQKVEFIQSHLMELGIINIKIKRLLLAPLILGLLIPGSAFANRSKLKQEENSSNKEQKYKKLLIYAITLISMAIFVIMFTAIK
tara:strand:- start:599 stop:856 length:258 start_codon:yes stop_codon:yes gene_type:complete